MKAKIRKMHQRGMKPMEIALRMGLKRATVAMHLSRASLTSREAYVYSDEEISYIISERAKGIYKGQILDIAEHLGRPFIGVEKKIQQLIRAGRTPRYAENKLPKKIETWIR